MDKPEIVDAAVIGVPDPTDVQGSESPRAYLVRREGATISEGDVNKWMSERLAKYKQLTGGISFVKEIPKVSPRVYSRCIMG